MSQANAAAIRRRVNPVNNVPGSTPQPQQNSNNAATDSNNVNSGGLTLPQVIAVIDRRLINLETLKHNLYNKPLPRVPIRIRCLN